MLFEYSLCFPASLGVRAVLKPLERGDAQDVLRDHLPGISFHPANLVDLVRHRARCQGDDVAFTYLVDGENEQVYLTNAELDRRARAIAAQLQLMRLVGERALLMYPAGLDFIAAFFGCLYAKVVACPIYPPRRNRAAARIRSVADDAGARVVLTTQSVLDRVSPLVSASPDLSRLTWLTTCGLPDALEECWEEPRIDGETLAFLQYTSGSTGAPKGVVLSHANLLHNSALIAHAFEHTRSSVGVFWLPSYHDMGLIGGIVQPLFIGRPNVLMSPMAFLQRPYRWLSAISRFGGTTSGGPNFAYELCVRSISPGERRTLDLSRWRVAFNGAEPVRAETIERFCEAFAPCGFRQESFLPCYGLAEGTLLVASGQVTTKAVRRLFSATALAAGEVRDRKGEEATRVVVGCGQCMPQQEIAIVDPDTMIACGEGRVGEIWLRGPSVAQGYWNNPEATAVTFQARISGSGEGPYLRTGDLGFLDQGELFVTGRIKDLIIIHGANFYPQDIEQTVQGCHASLRADSGAAFAIEIEGEERLVVVQEMERQFRGPLESVFDAIRSAVSAEHDLAVEEIVLVRAGGVPKTSSGKIQRHACREAYLAGSLNVIGRWRGSDHSAGGSASAVESNHGAEPTRERHTRNTAEMVLEQVRRIARERANGLCLDTPIGEIGLDSLERMEILAALERQYGGRFPPEILPELETCRQVVEAVECHLLRGSDLRVDGVARRVPLEHYRFENFPEYAALKQNLAQLESSGLGNPYFTVHEAVTNDRTRIDGREMLNYSSYNYLGMSGDPMVVGAAQEAAACYGTSVSASRLVSGQKPLHVELEQAIAQFLGTDDAIVLVGGHSTNETVIGHLLSPGDLVLHDALAHNSIVQGAILSGACRRAFPHNDWQSLDGLLERYRHDYRRVLIAIEGVYSMDGDIADLPRFVEVKSHHKALLMVDEAHSMGTLGTTGRGIGEHFGVPRHDVDVWMGTLSKSFGSCGGYIAGCQALVEYLRYTAPGFVYSVGISPPNAAAALASLRILEAEPHRVWRLQERSRQFLNLARRRGLNTGLSQDSPVVPVIIGNSLDCLALSRALFARGINVQPILHPAVEENAARLRFFLTSQHTEEQVETTVEALAEEISQIDPRYLKQVSPGPPVCVSEPARAA